MPQPMRYQLVLELPRQNLIELGAIKVKGREIESGSLFSNSDFDSSFLIEAFQERPKALTAQNYENLFSNSQMTQISIPAF